MGDPILILCGDDAVQRADLFHPERTPWQKSAIPQVSEHCGVPVLYSREHDATAGRHSAQGPRILGRQGAVGSRDWRAVGITVRMPQKLGQALRELVGDGVLQPLGLLVYVLPRVPEML